MKEENIIIKEKTTEIIGPWKMIWLRFKKKKTAVVGLIIFILLVLSSALAPFLTPYTLEMMDKTARNAPPSWQHWLGTDNLGRDYLTRMLYGGRISLKVGLFAVVISVLLGIIVGGIAGYYGGWIDNLMMRFTEIIMSFPFLPLAITVSAVVGGRVPGEYKMYITMAIIGLLGWPGLARIIRGQILTLREQEFMLATTALGLSDRRKIFKHLIPNTLGYVIVNATLGMASAILSESALSFLGLGVVPPTPTWGNLVLNARDGHILKTRPWLWIPPGVAIFLAVMSINLIGDGLRDAVDPKSHR